MSNSRKLISILLVIVVVFVGFLLTKNNKGNKFQGSVKFVKENSVIVYGAYESEVKKTKPLYDLEIKINERTNITKTAFFQPIGSGMFELDKAQKETNETDFVTLKKDSENVAIGIEVVLADDFWGKFISRAVEIKYIAPKY
ncbi:MAG: hypothetical protein CEO12_597 [Parcubacteria group bacterium Gr01-1014_46]|nr:MAG: hypothetical protein CEO12_597 [Parcubacteria group bacterium Gr01-1014_46]